MSEVRRSKATTADSDETAPFAKKHKQRPSFFLVPKAYTTNSVVQRVLEGLELKDKPGIVSEDVLTRMIHRWHQSFGDASMTDSRLDDALRVMREKTIKRYGSEGIGFIDWARNQKRIFSLFNAQLNTFERIFFTIDCVGETSSPFARFLSIFLMVTILISIVNWMVATLPQHQAIPEGCVYRPDDGPGQCAPVALTGFQVIEAICIYIFTLEFFVKIGTAHSVHFELLNTKFLEKFLQAATETGRLLQLDNSLVSLLKFVVKPNSIIDVLAILPFWLETFAGSGSGGQFLVVLRILRLTRIFRVFKLGKYNEQFSMFGRVMSQSRPALYLMLFFITCGMCLFGTLMWFCEQGEWHPKGHPELVKLGITERGAMLRDVSFTSAAQIWEESPFASIPHSFWFIVVTITTAGYGDMFPTTGLGKLVGTFTILCGIIVLAMPVGVIGTNFSQEYERVLSLKNKRKKMRAQLDVEAAVRASIINAAGGAHDKGEDYEDDIVLAEDLQHMSRLLDKAILIENKIGEILPPAPANCIQHDLRAFTCNLLNSRDAPAVCDLRAKLDELIFEAFAHLRSVLNYEPGSDPSPTDLLDSRKQFMELAVGCWAYWAEHPPRYEPAPEVVDLKLQMMRLQGYHTQQQGCHTHQHPQSKKGTPAIVVDCNGHGHGPGSGLWNHNLSPTLPGTPEAIG